MWQNDTLQINTQVNNTYQNDANQNAIQQNDNQLNDSKMTLNNMIFTDTQQYDVFNISLTQYIAWSSLELGA
jgi:hypothetical protein